MNQVQRLVKVKSICRRAILAVALLAVALLLTVHTANAQSTSGRVRGTVTDASGSAIAGAGVSLVNVATNVSREATTSATGEYIFLEVPVGAYEINVNQAGFKKFVRKDIVVDLNAVVGIDIALTVGGSTETVEVTGEPPVIDTTTTQLGAVVGSREVTELPLNARDTYQLLQLQPGVQSQLGNDLFYGSDKPGVVTVNGGRGRSNNYSVNGGDGNDLFANLPAVQPSPDTIEEFRVITNSFDAEYGRNSGAVVNVVTKSGTNDYHGSIFEFFRNKDLNAKGFYDPVKPDFQQNQFGGTLGGPIKKDKTFFFASYEGRRIKQGISSDPVPLPTSGQLSTGNFNDGNLTNPIFPGSLTTSTVASVLQGRCGSSLTTAANTALTNLIASGTPAAYNTLFPNATIPTQCFDPLSTTIYNSYVHPTSDGMFQSAPNKINNGDQATVKIDQDLTKNQKLSVYYYYDNDYTQDPFAKFQAAGGNLGNFPGVFTTRTQQLNASHTWTIGSTSVNEFRFSYFREGQAKFNTPTLTGDITASCGTGTGSAYCFNGLTTDQPLLDPNTGLPLTPSRDFGIHPGLGSKFEGLPFISVGGGLSLGNNFEGQLPQTGNTFQFADNFSKLVGNHSIKFGGDVRYQKFDQLLYYNVNGSISFGSGGANDLGGVCQQDPNPSNAGQCDPNGPGSNGNLYPNFLLGLPNSYSQGSAQHELVRSTSIYLYAQDSWKLRPNLTLNYGLRWEMNTPLTDIGKKVQTFRPGQVSSIYPCALDPNNPLYATYGPGQAGCDAAGVTPVGLVFPGDKGVPNGLTDTYFKAFAPRLGLNYSPSWRDGFLSKLTGGPNKMTISGGWGLFYNPIEQLVLEQFSAEPPFGGSNFISDPIFQAPFVTQGGSTNPNPFNGILNPPRNQPIDWSSFRSILLYGQFPKNLRTQYSAQYNLTIKRELPGNILFQIGYVGSQGHRLLASYDLNHGNPQTCNDLQAISTLNGDNSVACGPQSADNSYFVSASDNVPVGGLTLPYGGPNGGPFVFLPGGGNVGANNAGNGITLVGLRPYSSPLCKPLTGIGCPPDGTAVFSNIFTENTVAHSNYNSLQILVEKHFSHGLQFSGAYTYSKSLDNASSFESTLNPVNLNATYGPSLFDARHRFVFNFVWALPVPKFDGFKGQLLDGWQLSGIITYQTGFPVRITSSDDIEQFYSTFFEAPGEPNWTVGTGYNPGHLVKWDPRKHGGLAFDPNQFTNTTVAPGTIGNAPRSVCCSPGISNTDLGFFKGFQLRERLRMEFRTEIYNIFNHAQFYSVDGNISDGPTFGLAQKVREPRLFQFALKFMF